RIPVLLPRRLPLVGRAGRDSSGMFCLERRDDFPGLSQARRRASKVVMDMGGRDPRAVYAFDDVRVDRRRFQIARAGRPVPVEPKAFDLLILLIESHGEVVTKAEIFERLWPNTAVTDNA